MFIDKRDALSASPFYIINKNKFIINCIKMSHNLIYYSDINI